MKKIKDLLPKKLDENIQGIEYYSKYDPREPHGFSKGDKDAPAVLILKRKAIRIYPDHQKVALYYSQQLDKYISIPFGMDPHHLSGTFSVNEEVED